MPMAVNRLHVNMAIVELAQLKRFPLSRKVTGSHELQSTKVRNVPNQILVPFLILVGKCAEKPGKPYLLLT